MTEAVIVSIHIAPSAAAPTKEVDGVRAVAGRGLEGDRYFTGTGTYSKPGASSAKVTLIEIEALEALKRDYGIDLKPGESRRNIVTRGVPLNHLVGREFKIGEVKLRGAHLCEPCAHLQKLTREGVMRGLVHRGGLNAEILTDGVIRVGDTVEVDRSSLSKV
ncbi:MAG TPA: MOSC domain-containing protein [Candidatus Binatia bacterium]|jgi:MOSC domain-containing protein YiiM